MSRKKNKSPALSEPAPQPRKFPKIAAAAIVLLGVAAFFVFGGKRRRSGPAYFNRDVAPIVFNQCSRCHRPGESGPFNLLTYEDVSKHAAQILKVTQKRYMPPWLPEHGYGEFAEERRLSQDELDTLEDWVKQGAPLGDAKDAPQPPKFTDGWQLGEPDLILKVSAAYQLKAEGKDIYRNFAIPVGISEMHYVRAIEFRPNSPAVHHAFMFIDETPSSRILDEKDSEPGFEGMRTVPETAHFPEGHVLSWQPGRLPRQVPEGLSWRLQPGSDMVVQVHLQATGKAEPVQPTVGLYFTNDPPRRRCYMLDLNSWDIEIPAGEKAYVREESYTLPIDVEALGVMPHTHYLGKELSGYAMLPDGTKKWLLKIGDWDFNWQGDYRYKEPVFLPKGTVLHKHFTYDNSADNPRNPNHPPKAVQYGALTSDEMGELWFQLVPKTEEDYQALARDKNARWAAKVMEFDQRQLSKDPNNAVSNLRLGKMMIMRKQYADAERFLRAAAAADSGDDESHYYLGVMYEDTGRPNDAFAELSAAIRLNPKNYKACNVLGSMLWKAGRLREAEQYFDRALKIFPADKLVQQNLEKLREAMKGNR